MRTTDTGGNCRTGVGIYCGSQCDSFSSFTSRHILCSAPPLDVGDFNEINAIDITLSTMISGEKKTENRAQNENYRITKPILEMV